MNEHVYIVTAIETVIETMTDGGIAAGEAACIKTGAIAIMASTDEPK